MSEERLHPSMRVVAYEGAGGREVISVQDRPIPTPGHGEVLIKVAAAGINRADLLQRAGNYPVPEGASDLPGLEVSGTIEEAGAGVGTWDFGTPVCALLAGGGYAEYVAVPAGQVAPVPDGVSLTDAAGLPEVAATCWSNLFMQAGVQSGDWVLVHGGTGGIGSFALQLLAAAGARPIATAGSAEKVARSLELGAEAAINHREEDFVARVQEITGGHGADVILDVMGAKYLEPNVKALARGGRLVVIGLQGGATGNVPLNAVMGKNAVVTGTMLRPRPVQEKAEIMRQVSEHVWPLVASGAIRATTDSTFPLGEAVQAQDRFEEPDRTGKVLLVAGEGH
ncbi:NAD(P)H-quinone oxidoreductase [Citricoccus sp. I39-566]|nr:NAD(P)H-quinone oxidoreductase [Citricoccus sp. I39-566]WMY79428.1 NAD(P)H-quinone oxidoreductase [Citricoccus sp. I39-566]